MEVIIVDVFAEQPFSGNQLAVLPDAAGLTAAQMQAIALETNFSETTFVTRIGSDAADVRIFTPAAELPFAGHPTLGTAWVLARRQNRDTVTLNLAAGPVSVRFEGDLAWMTPPSVAFGDGVTPERAAALVSLPQHALEAAFPLTFAEVGPRFLLIGLRDLAALKAMKIDDTLFAELSANGAVFSVFAFTRDAYQADADFAARMFFSAGGVREDPATGSANTAFAAYLQGLWGGEHELIVDQGVEINRPSRLYLRIGEDIQVGGKVQPVFEGRLTQLPRVSGDA